MANQIGLFGETHQIGRPFLKWAGGKGQLLDTISENLPENIFDFDTYVEPFIGSGVVMFKMIGVFTNVKNIVINDFNSDLVNVYKTIKSNVNELILILKQLEKEYLTKDQEGKKDMFLTLRDEYNKREQTYTEISPRMAALFIFLNRTCFNGLHRVNSKNLFNVPFGKYDSPRICDTEALKIDSDVLQNVTILNGDYSGTLEFAKRNTFFYFDPPYKPISKTANFNGYSNDAFGDEQQIRLRDFCDEITNRGANFMLSNSDPKQVDETQDFFDRIYEKYNIKRVSAKRMINSNASNRGEVKELLITNY